MDELSDEIGNLKGDIEKMKKQIEQKRKEKENLEAKKTTTEGTLKMFEEKLKIFKEPEYIADMKSMESAIDNLNRILKKMFDNSGKGYPIIDALTEQQVQKKMEDMKLEVSNLKKMVEEKKRAIQEIIDMLETRKTQNDFY